MTFDLLKQQLRGRTTLLLFTILFIADLISRDSQYPDIKILFAALSIALWYINTTTINDLSDEEVDKINLKNATDRPLINGAANRTTMVQLYALSAILSVLFALIISGLAGLIMLLFLALSYVYSMPPFRVSSRGIMAQLLLPLGYAGLPFALAFIVNGYSISIDSLILFIGLYMAFIARMLLKDFRDFEGDKQFGKRTFLVRHGGKVTSITAMIFWAVANFFVVYFIRSEAFLIMITEIFIVLILWGLFKLSLENNFDKQMLLIGFVNRCSNVVTLLVLTAATIMETDLNVPVFYIYTVVLFTSVYVTVPYYEELKNRKLLPSWLKENY